MDDTDNFIADYGTVSNKLYNAMRVHFQKQNASSLEKLRRALKNGDRATAIGAYLELAGTTTHDAVNYIDSMMDAKQQNDPGVYDVFVMEDNDVWYKLNPNIGQHFETSIEAKTAASKQLANYPGAEVLVCKLVAKTKRVLADC